MSVKWVVGVLGGIYTISVFVLLIGWAVGLEDPDFLSFWHENGMPKRIVAGVGLLGIAELLSDDYTHKY